MSESLKKLKTSKVRIFGFSWPVKTFCITLGIAVGALILLLALDLFGVNISWYGVMFGLGFLVALALSTQLCKERDLSEEHPYSLVWWVFPLSIIGARLYFLIFDGLESFVQIFRIWDGGLAVYGGVIGGFIGLVACCLINKVSIVKSTDIVAPVLSLGQAFGRIGCIFGNCCYGVEVTKKALQWFPVSLKVHDKFYFATNFYEAIFDVILFFILTTVLRKTKIKGIPTFSYLFGYGIVRFVLEFFREPGQTLFIGTMPVSQLVSILCVLAGAVGICVLLFVNNRKSSKEAIIDKE